MEERVGERGPHKDSIEIHLDSPRPYFIKRSHFWNGRFWRSTDGKNFPNGLIVKFNPGTLPMESSLAYSILVRSGCWRNTGRR